jgi:tRNA threonylcarbamoyladenosine biosynthesis protein TsaB
MSIYILQIETSTDICSCAISLDGSTVVTHKSVIYNTHTELLTILIERCILDLGITYRQLHAVAISSGPGSYTSLRVGASTAKGMCYALGIPLIGLRSLDVLAQGVTNVGITDVIVPMIDARRMEVYMSVLDHAYDILKEQQAILLDNYTIDYLSPEAFFIHLCGSGASKYIDAYPSPRLRLHHIETSATLMSEMAYAAYNSQRFEDIAYFEVDYLKPPNITKSQKKLF